VERQLGEVEGLRQVVVGTETEPTDRSPGESAAMSMRTIAGSSLSLTMRQRASPGRPRSSTEHVVGVDVDLGGGVEAVVGDVDGHAMVAEAPRRRRRPGAGRPR
jgi:hypothetical protein